MEALTPRDPKRYTFDNGVNPYGESYSSVFSGGSSAAPASTATPERYSRLPDAPDTPMLPGNDTRSMAERTIFESAQPVNEQSIREEKRKAAQSSIDAINASFNRVIQQEKEAGQVRADRGRSLNIAAGLGGSDFGSARAEEIDSKNREVVQLAEQERDAKVAAILANVEDTASAAIAARKQEALLGAEKTLSLMKQKQEEARKQVTDLAASGVSLDALKEKSPDTYQKLVDTTGDDPLLLEAVFNQAASAKNKVDYTYHSLGDGRVLRTGKKGDGTAVSEQIFNYPSLTKDTQLVITPDGTPLIFDKQTGQASIAPGFREGQFLKPETRAGTGDGSGSGEPSDTVKYYGKLLHEGKITLSNVPQGIRNAVVRYSQGDINSKLSDTALDTIRQSEGAVANLGALRSTIEKNLQYVGPIAGFQKLNPYSKARQVQAEVDRVKQQVGKALEGGVLRKEDEDKYKKILATLNDTPETALSKIDGLITAINRDIDNFKSIQSENGRYVPSSDAADNDPLGIRN
jgi:hypothetical protein